MPRSPRAELAGAPVQGSVPEWEAPSLGKAPMRPPIVLATSLPSRACRLRWGRLGCKPPARRPGRGFSVCFLDPKPGLSWSQTPQPLPWVCTGETDAARRVRGPWEAAVSLIQRGRGHGSGALMHRVRDQAWLLY